jgi:hypothetical protein
MLRNLTCVLALAAMTAPLICYADSSYEHTMQVTGGQLIDAIKNIPFAPKSVKALTEPTTETTMVHGNQKAIISKDYTEIWDLDKEQIIHIDNARHTYSVITFADMRKMIAEMPAKMAEMQQQMQAQQAKMKQQQGQAPAVPSNLKFSFTVDVKDTGLTKMFDQYNAKQQIMTMKMMVTDTNNPGTNITYAFTDEIWTTQDLPAEMKDAREFDMRFGKALMQGADTKDLMSSMANMRNGAQSAMSQMFGAQPGASDAFAEMQRQLAKITGTRLVEITRMGGSGTGMDNQQGGAAGSNGSQAANGSGSGGNGSGGNTSTTNVGSPSSMLGGALLGAWRKKKAQQQQDNPPPASTAPAGTPGQPQDVTLMEMTASTHAFSSAPVSTAVFQIPAGFKQVESPMEQMMNKK